jgi:indolepyruvate ferredoxin oxidoreductase beta subunit
MENRAKNILMVGVGGQGVILASNILSEVAMASGLDVKKNEAHGQSQRGGTVPSHVRFGKKVYSPVIGRGEADAILAFEELEGLRFAQFLHPDGMMILNRQRIYPPRVTSGIDRYPEDVISMLQKNGIGVVGVDALALANRMGNPVVVSTVLLGVLSNYLDFSPGRWKAGIKKIIPERHRMINLEAFEAGRSLV